MFRTLHFICTENTKTLYRNTNKMAMSSVFLKSTNLVPCYKKHASSRSQKPQKKFFYNPPTSSLAIPLNQRMVGTMHDEPLAALIKVCLFFWLSYLGL